MLISEGSDDARDHCAMSGSTNGANYDAVGVYSSGVHRGLFAQRKIEAIGKRIRLVFNLNKRRQDPNSWSM